MNRREFLHVLAKIGGLTAVGVFLEACNRAERKLIPTSPPKTVTAAPPPTQAFSQNDEMKQQPKVEMTQIAFVKTTNRQLGVEKAIELLNINPVNGKQVFLKPNFNSSDLAPGSTHPDILKTLISKLQAMGATSVILGDRSGMGNTRQVMEQIGIFKLEKELGFKTVVLDELPAEDWALVNQKNHHWKKGFPMPRICLESDVIVQTCCLKTHRFGGHFTMSLKNSVGLAAKYVPGESYNYMDELHTSKHQRKMIAEINTAYSPGLIILDGVEAFVTGGPDQGRHVSSNVVLAGTDRVAIDAAGVAILRYFGTTPEVSAGAVFEQEQIAQAVALGIGVDSPEKIEFITGDGESAAYAGEIQDILLGKEAN